MKKVILSISLIFGFTVYAEYQHNTPSFVKDTATSSQNVEKPISLNLDSSPNATATDVPKNVPKQQPFIKSDEENNDYENEDRDDDEEETRNARRVQTASSRTSLPQTTVPQKSSAQTMPITNMGGNMMMHSQYKNGEYTGNIADAYYGNIQVKAIIFGGKIANVQFLDYPNDRQNSIRINTHAMPLLKSEAIQAQSAKVDVISGATATSEAFRESLASALAQAKN